MSTRQDSTRQDAPPPGPLRLILFGLACLALAPLVVALARAMPAFGAHALPYGDAINAAGPPRLHVTNMVSAVNFGFRGFDALGEEFMLVCAVTGASVLLRGSRGEQTGAKPGIVEGRAILARLDAAVLLGRLLAPLTLLFGLSVALHAMTTPGGGFQGGVIIASSTLLLFLGEGYTGWRGMLSSHALDACEGAGAAFYALCGLASMAAGSAYLGNFLPLGQLKSLFSGGLMLAENAGVGLAVAAGFAVLFLEFLEETRAEQPDPPA